MSTAAQSLAAGCRSSALVAPLIRAALGEPGDAVHHKHWLGYCSQSRSGTLDGVRHERKDTCPTSRARLGDAGGPPSPSPGGRAIEPAIKKSIDG